MIKFFIVDIICVAVLCLFFYGVAHAAPSIERSIDNHTILLNAAPCNGVGGTGWRMFNIENNVVHAGCWVNDGKHVNMTIDGIVTQYDKRLFELGVK